MSINQSNVSTIRLQAQDIDALKFDIKSAREMLKDIIEDTDEFKEYEDAKVVLAQAKANLQDALMRKQNYADLTEKIGESTDKLKSKEDILSELLVGYFADTHETQIEVDETNGDARPLILKGKLGKKQKYQTNLFAEGSKA